MRNLCHVYTVPIQILYALSQVQSADVFVEVDAGRSDAGARIAALRCGVAVYVHYVVVLCIYSLTSLCYDHFINDHLSSGTWMGTLLARRHISSWRLVARTYTVHLQPA